MSRDGIDLEAVARAVGPGLGPEVRSGEASVEPVPVPGAPPGVIWAIRDDLLDHPLQGYVGLWPDGLVRLLSDDQEAWTDLMRAVGVRLDDPQTAVDYVRRFLEVTRGPSVIVYEVIDAAGLPWRPGSPAEEGRRQTLLTGQPLPPPVAERTTTGFHVELTLVVDQRIQRNLFDLTPSGEIDASFQVLADELPLPIAR
jgi:hypothetical protein